MLQLRWREDEAALNALANSTSAEAAVNAEQMQDDPAAARRAARNRQARARRAQERAEQLGDVELASAFRQLYGPAASDAIASIPAAVPLLLEVTTTVDHTPVTAAVAVAEAATATSPIVYCYVKPNVGVRQFEEIMERIDILIRGHPRVLLAGDFNAWHTAWGSERTKPKGIALLQLVNGLGLEVLNIGTSHTFRGCGSARLSRIDVAFASPSICRPDLAANSATCWRILSRYSYSDHVYIRYTVGEQPPREQQTGTARRQRTAVRLAGTRWNTRQFDPTLFESALRSTRFEDRATHAKSRIESLTRACDETMSRVFPSQDHTGRPAYWCTPAIEELENESSQNSGD